MSEKAFKELTLEERQEYFAKKNRDKKRQLRIKNKKCRCGSQGFARILLTQEIVCAKHAVAPLKEELTKQLGVKTN